MLESATLTAPPPAATRAAIMNEPGAPMTRSALRAPYLIVSASPTGVFTVTSILDAAVIVAAIDADFPVPVIAADPLWMTGSPSASLSPRAASASAVSSRARVSSTAVAMPRYSARLPAMSITAAYVIAISLLVTDAAGLKPLKPIALEAAEAFSAECNLHPMWDLVIPGDELCAGTYVVHSFRESGWDLKAVGDSGHSFGPFQLYERRLPKSWKEAVTQFSPLLKRAAVCMEKEGGEPLEMLATGKCGTSIGQTISRARTKEARRIVLAQRFFDYPGR